MNKKITHYKLEFHPGVNKGIVFLVVEGQNQWIKLPIESYDEFIICSLILQTGKAYMQSNGAIVSSM